MPTHLTSAPSLPNVAEDGAQGSAALNILSLTLAYGPDTAKTAQENLRAIASRCSGRRRSLLMDLRMATDQTEGARLCYRHTLVHLVGSIAVVVGPNVSRFLGEFLVRTLRAHHEVRLFLNDDHARSWLAAQGDTR